MAVVWRHKNKLLLLCAVLGGGYAGINFLRKKLQAFQDKNATVTLEAIRFNEHFLGNYNTAVSAVLELLPSLKEAIQNELNTEAITNQLRLKPSNKRDLWENLKIISFTRLVGGAYAYVLLSVFMRIQLSILGGRMFGNINKSAANDTEVQKQYLATVQHLLKEGLHALIKVVHESSDVILSQYSLKQHLSCDGVLQIIKDIRHQVTSLPAHTPHSPLSHRKRQHFILHYAMPKELLVEQDKGGKVGEEEEVRAKNLLLLGTRDLLESSVVGCVVTDCVEEVFKQVAIHVTDSFMAVGQGRDILPLPRVIPLVCDISLHLFNTPPSQNLLSNRDLQTLSRNIYEAFAHDTVS